MTRTEARDRILYMRRVVWWNGRVWTLSRLSGPLGEERDVCLVAHDGLSQVTVPLEEVRGHE